MLPTLHRYILGDLSKTFLLTAVGLTAVLGLGGGVMNLVELEEVTPGQLLKLMLIVVPVAGTLTLPVAALYSATVTYGRLAADNEILACRSAGINIHVLFLSSVVISLVSSVGTFVFICYMIPGLIQNLSNIVRGDVRQFIEHRVNSPERLSLPGGRVKIYADGTAANPDDPDSIILNGVAFVAFGAESWTRYGTAESFTVRFGSSGGDPTISGELHSIAYYDRERGWAASEYQSIPPNKIPLRMRPKVKWLNLTELLGYRVNPGRWPKLNTLLVRLREAVAREHYYAEIFDDLRQKGVMTIRDAETTITIRAGAGTVGAHDGRLSLDNVTVIELRGAERRTITASHAALAAEIGTDKDTMELRILLDGDVRSVRDGDRREPINKARERLAGIRIPDRVLEQARSIDDDELLDPRTSHFSRPASVELRDKAIAMRGKFVRDVTSEIHSRLAFSVSAFVLVVLGAALGVVSRGDHVLGAFGLSFIPSLFVIVMNITGRQLAEKEGTVVIGLCVIWGALVLVGLLDLWIMTRVIRR